MKKITLIGLVIIIILVILAVFQGSKISRLSDEVERQKANVETLVSKERTYRICDSINVAEIQALQLDRKQFEKLVLDKDRQIQELQDKRKKDIEYYTRLAKTDTYYVYKDRFIEVPIGNDTCLGYYDNYIQLTQCPDCTYIEIQDTIKQTISKHYKHKFLWFRWGVDGITQDVWSTNPHSNIHFEEFVKIDD